VSKKKTQPLFTLVFDDIVRSPDLSSTDLRLYMVMLSYCPKTRTDGVKVCRLTKPVMASILRISERAIYTTLRRLQALELIDITYFENDERKPIYSVMTGPRPDMSPDNLKGTRLATALAYVEDAGGSKNLRRRKLQPRMKDEKRTGHPEAFTNGFTLEEPEVVPGDDLVDALTEKAETSEPPQLPEKSSPTAPPYGTGVPHPMEAEFHSYGSGVPQVWKPSSIPYGTGVLPVRDGDKSSLKSPNGLKNGGDMSHLVLQTPVPGPPPTGARAKTVRRVDIKNDLEDDPAVAKPTKEELEAERFRQKGLRGGERPQLTDLKIPEGKGKSHDDDDVPPKRPRRGSGAPPSDKDETQEVLEKHLTADPDSVSEVPNSPWGLYGHFCKVVRKKYPDAKLPMVGKGAGKYLKWGKLLLSSYSTSDLYEMIQVLVLDFENIRASKVFFKYAGTTTPTYEQLYCNAETLVTFIGSGLIAPPAVRVSSYADDYQKRHSKDPDITNDPSNAGRTAVDPIEALRDQING